MAEASRIDIDLPPDPTQRDAKIDNEAPYVSQLPALTPMTPMAMVGHAVATGASVEVIERLMALQERWEANQARKAFDEAMAAAKAEMPVISKNRLVSFPHKGSDKVRTEYRHEDLAEIARTIDPILGKYGLSYRFRTTSDINAPVTVTCVVSHRLGHSENNMLSAGRDTSGSKNDIQAMGSTITYLQRYALKAALGLAASYDDDGRMGGGGDGDTEDAPITEQQVAIINQMMLAAKVDEPKFFAFVSKLTSSEIKAPEDIPTSYYDAVVNAINDKAKKGAKGGKA